MEVAPNMVLHKQKTFSFLQGEGWEGHGFCRCPLPLSMPYSMLLQRAFLSGQQEEEGSSSAELLPVC